MDNNLFLDKCKSIHGDEYILDTIEFCDWKTKITPTCKIHGVFCISPISFLYKKHGCPKCRGKRISSSKRLSQEDIITKFKEVHGNTYNYDNVIYEGIDKKVDIICNKHGTFKQTPYNHIYKKCGCPKCKYEALSEKYRYDIKELISNLSSIHNRKYTYPNIKEEYVNNRSIITAICPIHGKFNIMVNKHQQGQGCPICNESKLETEISKFLDDNDIEYERQKKFEWLCNIKNMSLDFYLPKYNIAIECQGEQHFRPIDYFGGNHEYDIICNRDKIKYNLCKEHGLNIFYFSTKEFENIDYLGNIYCDKERLFEEITRLQ